MIEKLTTSPYTLTALGLIITALAGLVLLRHASASIRKGLWAGLIVTIALLLYVALKPAPPAPPQQLLTGSISVPAYRADGTPFQNYLQFPVTMEFSAEGRWSVSEHPDSIADAAGQTAEKPADNRYLLPDAPIGSLIMQRTDTETFEYVGNSKTIELASQEQVLFFINDFTTDKAYSNNTGLLKLHWTCFNCIR